MLCKVRIGLHFLRGNVAPVRARCDKRAFPNAGFCHRKRAMKNILLTSLLISLSALADWKTPAVLCPEDALPQERPCLDLSRVVNPQLDFPAELSAADVHRWSTSWSKDLKVCRARETLRRESVRPGSSTPLQVQISWMTANGGENSAQKLHSIVAAAETHQMPVHVLIGALTQESLLASLGVSSDGGNYSCGIGQLNISEWCLGMQTLSAPERARYGWPTGVACEGGALTSELVAPFYQLALKKLDGRPEYRLDAADFSGITYEEVVGSFPAAESSVQLKRFQAVSSFVAHCQKPELGIPFKARNIKSLYERFVPATLKAAEMNPFPAATTCVVQPTSRHYPLHTGWLLALAAYNAGPSVAKLLEHYHQAPFGQLPALTPTDLIEALYWGGKVGARNRVYYRDSQGRGYSQTWYKSCVVQRHVARVVQHVSRPGHTLARSLEPAACSSEAPTERRASSGVKSPDSL